MDRRGFLCVLVRGTAAAPLLSAAALGDLVRDRIVVQRSPVAGFQFHEGEKVFARLRIGMPLELRREPANRHDARAVAVYAAGRKLGYVPRAENAAVAQMLDRGERLSARIVALKRSRDPWERVWFEVRVA